MSNTNDMRGEVLDASLTKGEALKLEQQARRHLAGMNSNAFAFAVDLRRLQDGGAHLLRGFPSFGEFVEAKFDDISAENAKKLSLVGKVVIALVDAGKVTLAAGDHKAAVKILGTTGARALSALQSKQGTKRMLEVFDTAAAIVKEEGSVITDETVKAIVQGLLEDKEPKPKALAEPEEEENEMEPLEEHGELTIQFLDRLASVQGVLSKLSDEIDNGEKERARISMVDAVDGFHDLTAGFEKVLAELTGAVVFDEDSDAAFIDPLAETIAD